ncbi:Ig-like domain-containing protein [Rhizobium alvei]|uniref:Ig-like domain-containing protein n=1 Tax=Rhizobium alvei TaxID=1132659 RepID=A0ABT8YN56_9HYPH|nr:Ig-like domain-containing protein [Rhizobium alvei]MDO6964793.1 Ig-like domain-containing protein [Rhizobium alvei]
MTSYTETLVNTQTNNHQNLPAIAALADGGWVITWMSADQDGNGYGIFAQRYAADGSLVDDEFLVNSYLPSDQYEPTIAALDDGGFIICWASDGQDGSGFGIYGMRFNADGVQVGNEFRVNSYTTGEQSGAAVTALEDGGFVVAWTSYLQDGSSFGVYQQRYDKYGNTVGNETQVNYYTTNGQSDASVTGLADGGWVVTWSSNGQDGYGFGIYMRIYDASGAERSIPSRVNVDTDSQQIKSTVVPLDDGGFIVGFMDYLSGKNLFRRFDANGVAIGTVTAASDIGDAANLSIAVLEDGGFVMTWSDGAAGDTSIGVRMRRFDADGEAMGAATLVNTTKTGEQSYSTVTALADGGWVVTWRSYQGGSSFDVYMQRYNADGGKVSITAPEASNETVALAEDHTHTFSVDDFGFSDADGDTLAFVTIEALPESGSLTLNGVSVSKGQAIAAADIVGLEWTPDRDQNGVAAASLAFSVTDSYGTTSSETHKITFDLSAEADAPKATDRTVSLIEDLSYSFSIADFGFSDADGDALSSITITALPTLGSLTLNGVAIQEGDDILAADIAHMVWTPDADLSGEDVAQLKFTVHDDSGAVSASDYVLSFDVEDVNDAPSATGKTITISEDQARAFSSDDFGFSDTDGDQLAYVVISALPSSGSLTFDGAAVTAGQKVAVADLESLIYMPAVNACGKNLASFTYQVIDDGGRSHDGENRSLSSATLRIDVTDSVDRFIGTSASDRLTGTMGADVIRGLDSADRVSGGAGKDRIDGGAGHDRLSGGGDSDRFVFSGSFGKDTITDFDAVGSDHDLLDISSIKSITSWNDLTSHHMRQVGDDVVIDAGSGATITLSDLWIRTLDKADVMI